MKSLPVFDQPVRRKDVIDFIGLSVLMALCYLYAMYYSLFSETNIQFSFLNFPVFVGEICMIGLFGLAVVKAAGMVQKREWSVSKWQLLLGVFFFWILVKALRGYFGWGPLAFRNAALFYYVIFAAFGYLFYNPRFFSRFIRLAILIIVILTTWGFRRVHNVFNDYYIFTFFCFFIICLFFKPSKRIRIGGVGLLLFFDYPALFQASRSHLIAVAGALVTIALYYVLGKVKTVKSRMLLMGVIIGGLLISVLSMGERTALKSLVDFQGIREQIAVYDEIISDKEKTFSFAPLQVNLFNKDLRKRRTYIIFEETKQGAFILLDRILEDTEGSYVSPDFRQFFLTHKQELYTAIDGYLDSERELYLQGKQVELSRILELIDDYYQRYLRDSRTVYQVPDKISDTVPALPAEIAVPAAAEPLRTAGSVEPVKPVEPVEPVKPVGPPSGVTAQAPASGLEQSPSLQDVQEEQWNNTLSDLRENAIPELQIMLEASLSGSRTVDANNGTSVFRFLIWRDMIDQLWQYHPVFGFNFGMPQRSRSLEILNIGVGEWSRDGYITPHNVILHAIYRGGIVGLAAVVFLIAVIFMLYRGFLQQGSMIGPWMVGILVYWLIMANFLVILELPHYAIPFWTWLGLTFAYYQEQRHKTSAGNGGAR